MQTKAKLSSVVGQMAYLPRTFRLIWGAARGWTLVWGILLVVQGIVPVALVYLTKLLVDSLVIAIGSRGSWEIRAAVSGVDNNHCRRDGFVGVPRQRVGLGAHRPGGIGSGPY